MAPKLAAELIECENAKERMGRMRLDQNCSSKIGWADVAPLGDAESSYGGEVSSDNLGQPRQMHNP